MNHRLNALAVVGLLGLFGSGGSNAAPVSCGAFNATLTLGTTMVDLSCSGGTLVYTNININFSLSAIVSSTLVELGMNTGGAASIGGVATWDFGLQSPDVFATTLTKDSDTFSFPSTSQSPASPADGATSLTSLSGGAARFTILDGLYGEQKTFRAVYSSDEQQVPEPGTIQLALLSLGLLWGLGRRRSIPGPAAA